MDQDNELHRYRTIGNRIVDQNGLTIALFTAHGMDTARESFRRFAPFGQTFGAHLLRIAYHHANPATEAKNAKRGIRLGLDQAIQTAFEVLEQAVDIGEAS